MHTGGLGVAVHTSNLVVQSQSQESCLKFKVSLFYKASSRPARTHAHTHNWPNEQNRKSRLFFIEKVPKACMHTSQ